MNVSDYIVKFLSDRGVRVIFMITGGQAMFLNDAVHRNKKISPVFTHHEQAAGMAAEAYGRINGKLGVAMVTAGPGAINVLNGVVGAYCDSSPMMVISGMSPSSNVTYMEKTKIRQYGLQGIYIKPFAQSSTKYFKSVDDPSKIQYYMEKAYHLATTGRHGPVWIEVPLDIQRMEVPMRLLESYVADLKKDDSNQLKTDVRKVVSLLKKSERPLILAGQGIRLAGGTQEFGEVLEKINTPVITTRLGIDLVESDNPLFVGRPGLYGDRGANIAVQNADLIISIGARLDTGIVGYDAKNWGRHAKKIVVDIDTEELNKPGVNIHFKIMSDAKEFILELLLQLNEKKLPDFGKWRKICSEWRNKYPTVLSSYKRQKPVNSYYFSQRLSQLAASDDIIVVDTSSCFHVVSQSWHLKGGQRFLTTGGISTMGYWVAAIGACFGGNLRRTLVITGDGSLQMNIQELATIKQNKLPIKVFVLNNNGYLLIRHTQKTHMGGRMMGESPKTGLWCPDSGKIAKAYGIYSVSINNSSEVDRKIKQALSHPGPVICDVKSPQWQLIIPRISSSRQPDGSMVSRPYEDLFPFLSNDELKSNMVSDSPKKSRLS